MTTSHLIALLKADEANEKLQQINTEPELPAYYTDACAQMAEYLPTAITQMKTLAHGASTTIETETGEVNEIVHAPDPLANQFLMNLFLGAPTSRFKVKVPGPIDLSPNADAITRYTDNIIKLCTAHPDHTGKETHIRSLLQQLIDNI